MSRWTRAASFLIINYFGNLIRNNFKEKNQASKIWNRKCDMKVPHISIHIFSPHAAPHKTETWWVTFTRSVITAVLSFRSCGFATVISWNVESHKQTSLSLNFFVSVGPRVPVCHSRAWGLRLGRAIWIPPSNPNSNSLTLCSDPRFCSKLCICMCLSQRRESWGMKKKYSDVFQLVGEWAAETYHFTSLYPDPPFTKTDSKFRV